MEKRRFGRTGHHSAVAILGGAAFGKATQAETDAAMERVIGAGVNHIDVAPSYGNAEERLGPWLARERKRFFLGCKTLERTKEGAAAELRRSLERLQVDAFDLYQLHAVNTLDELNKITAPGGALEAVLDAREQELTKYIGITGHGLDAPAIFLEALRLFDFDSVLFPLNFVLYANPIYRANAQALLRECHARDIGTMVIKANCEGPWGERPRVFNTWYEPFDEPAQVQQAINFALSQDVTGVCTSGDLRILPLFLDACEHWMRLSENGQATLLASASNYQPLFS
ncbi:MAG: aldo/keto reductase [Chloroflexi bacterium]|nr:aldo/keto reductase [Chloroflexota bacterium]